MKTDNINIGLQSNIAIIDVSVDNVAEIGIYCIKDEKSPGCKAKVEWFKSKINKGLKIKIAVDKQDKQLGFIEYIPSELAWRPVKADDYLFIQCIALFDKDAHHKNIGTSLLRHCENDAKELNKSGICVMSSDGAWMANKTFFEKNGFLMADKLERFELMYKAFSDKSLKPHFVDWTKERTKYKGWHLIYSDQCPWHEKSITDIKQSALDNGIDLKIKKLTTPKEAQNAPSGFGTFSLLKDGRLLGDHYLSKTRFENILRQEMRIK
jgi:GNAT superfamily N-acetyltransferase